MKVSFSIVTTFSNFAASSGPQATTLALAPIAGATSKEEHVTGKKGNDFPPLNDMGGSNLPFREIRTGHGTAAIRLPKSFGLLSTHQSIALRACTLP